MWVRVAKVQSRVITNQRHAFNLTLRDEDCQLNKSSSLRNAPQEPTIQN
jgi:hypothetical protein